MEATFEITVENPDVFAAYRSVKENHPHFPASFVMVVPPDGVNTNHFIDDCFNKLGQYTSAQCIDNKNGSYTFFGWRDDTIRIHID